MAPQQHHRADPILQLQPSQGNQPPPQTLEPRSDELNAGTTGREVSRLGYDFSRIPVYADLPARTPARLTVQSRLAPDPREMDQPPFRVNPRVPAALPATTPAWTTHGEIHLGPTGLFIGPRELGRMLRHEAFHRLHQRVAGVSEAAGARTEAEQLATRAESGFSFPLSLAPAPALLAFPPQTYAPWDRVWIGGGQIIGEVNEEGVAVRIILSYADIGITTGPEAQTYHCGKHDPKPIPALVARMRKAAKQAAVLNRQIPEKDYPLKTALIAIYPHANSGFREAGGKGLLVVKQEDSWEETIAHEGSHGIFAFHLGEHVTSGAPDALAKRFAALFLQLKNTAAVSRPTGVFDPAHPPPLKDDGSSTTQPAGLVMVTDELWAGSGGHPWDTVDEFFASAHGAYQQKRPLLEKIVAYYGKADKKIPPLAKELFALLGSVDDPKALASLKAPADPKAADAELQRIVPTPTATESLTSLLVSPDTLPGPSTILCPAAKPSATAPAGKEKPASTPAAQP